jgi:hypothetical protein
VALGLWGWRGLPDSGEAGGGDGRERVGEGSRGHVRPIWVLVWGGNTAGGRARWRPVAGAAGGFAPASLQFGLGNK